MGVGRGQGQTAKGLGLFLFRQGVGEEPLGGEKDGQRAPSPALNCPLPLLSLLAGYLALSFSSMEPAFGPGGWCFVLKTSLLRLCPAVPNGVGCRVHRYRSRPWQQVSKADLAGAKGEGHSQLAQDEPRASTVSESGLQAEKTWSPWQSCESKLEDRELLILPRGLGLWQQCRSGADSHFMPLLPV